MKVSFLSYYFFYIFDLAVKKFLWVKISPHWGGGSPRL
jgi:hypothetical protein